MGTLTNNKLSRSIQKPSFPNGTGGSDTYWSGSVSSIYYSSCGTDNSLNGTSWAYGSGGGGFTTSSTGGTGYMATNINLYKTNVDFRVYLIAYYSWNNGHSSSSGAWTGSAGFQYWNGSSWVTLASVNNPASGVGYTGSASNTWNQPNCRIIWISDTQFKLYAAGALVTTGTVSSTTKTMYLRVYGGGGGGNQSYEGASGTGYIGAFTDVTHAFRIGRVATP